MVARVLQIGTIAAVGNNVHSACSHVRLDVVQPVLPLYVVGLAFLGVIGGDDELEQGAVAGTVREGESGQIVLVEVNLLTIVEDQKLLAVLQAAEPRVLVCGLVDVAVAREIS